MMVEYRPYKCLACGHIHEIQTNHLGSVFADCPKCSWKCRSFAPEVSVGATEGRCDRKHEYCPPKPRVRINLKTPEIWAAGIAEKLQGKTGEVFPSDRRSSDGKLLVSLDDPPDLGPEHPNLGNCWWIKAEDLDWLDTEKNIGEKSNG